MPKCAPGWLSHSSDPSLRQERLPGDAWAQNQGAKLRLPVWCSELVIDRLLMCVQLSNMAPEGAGQKSRHQTCMPKWMRTWPCGLFLVIWNPLFTSFPFLWPFSFPCHSRTGSLSYRLLWLCFSFLGKKLKGKTKTRNYKWECKCQWLTVIFVTIFQMFVLFLSEKQKAFTDEACNMKQS